MDLLPFTIDNISELLLRIVEFTQKRQQILTNNIHNIHEPGFEPKDLAIEEFCILLNEAITEHVRHQRLVLHSSPNIQFNPNGIMTVKPVIDHHAKRLLCESSDKYLEYEINRLLENTLNQKVAAELLRQKQTTQPASQQYAQKKRKKAKAESFTTYWD